jgi:hypothetical protein
MRSTIVNSKSLNELLRIRIVSFVPSIPAFEPRWCSSASGEISSSQMARLPPVNPSSISRRMAALF